MKNILALCLMLVAITSCQMNSNTTNSTKLKTIMIESVGKVETMPNEASFYINLSCLDKSVTTAKECLVKQSNELMSKLLAHGIKQEDIQTNSVSLDKSYTWTNNTRVFEGYRSSTSMHVKMRDLNKLDVIYTDLLENEKLELGGLTFSHSDMDNLKNDAYVNALKKADILADKLLTELPEKNKEVLKIGNVQITSSNPVAQEQRNMMYAKAEASDAGSVAISAGKIKVEATLYVEYQIK
jgi:uncharacterized protein YggE